MSVRSGRKRPPRLGEWLIGRMSAFDRFAPLGDLEEEYNSILCSEGALRADMFYWRQALLALPSYLGMLVGWNLNMLASYMRVSSRLIAKHKGFSAINILGLAIGMACCTLIMLWVQDELGFDSFHEKADRTYRVVFDRDAEDVRYVTATTPAPLGEAMRRDFPEIERVTMVGYAGALTVKAEGKRFEERWFEFVDPDFFEIFSFRLVKGSPETVFADPYSVVITRSTAERFFGQEDPVGRSISVNGSFDLTVSGVVADFPDNSTIKAELLSPFETFTKTVLPPGAGEDWGRHSYDTFVLLADGADVDAFNTKFADYKARFDSTAVMKGRLQPFRDIHLRSAGISDSFGNKGDIRYVILFATLASMILLIACINFMNLATARSTNRAREVGTRKVVGARRSDIMRQFFCETLLLSGIALVASIPVVWLALPGFNAMSGKDLSFGILGNVDILAGLAAMALLTGLVSGSYPSLVLSRFSPAGILRGGRAKNRSSYRFGSVLVVSQFTLSIILITATIVLMRQLDFMFDMNVGYDRSRTMSITMPGEIVDRYDVIKQELGELAGVSGVTASYSPMSWMYSAMSGLDWEGRSEDDPDVEFWIEFVDHDFVETLGLQMVAGRDYSPEFTADQAAYILNEEAVRQKGVESPVGMRLTIDPDAPGTVIGVIKDYNFRSLHNPIEPLILRYDPRMFNFIHVKIAAGDLEATTRTIESKWEEFSSGLPFRYRFVDAELDMVYRDEKRIGSIFRWAAALGIFISCLGLIGLASFVVEKKTKEIGIRKVLGASEVSILAMITGGLVKWVLLANAIAWPAAYYILGKYLGLYAYRRSVDWYIYVLAGSAALTTAVLTVSLQAFRAARANPIRSIKYE